MSKHDGEELWEIRQRRVRDIVILLLGTLGCINELFLLPEPRWEALVFIAALLGLPAILKIDELRRK